MAVCNRILRQVVSSKRAVRELVRGVYVYLQSVTSFLELYNNSSEPHLRSHFPLHVYRLTRFSLNFAS
jgi:hypothetical protein